MCVLGQPREQEAAIQNPADPLSTRRVVASIPAKVYMDGSNIAKRPTELCYLYAPQIHHGAFAPPLVVILVSLGALWVQPSYPCGGVVVVQLLCPNRKTPFATPLLLRLLGRSHGPYYH